MREIECVQGEPAWWEARRGIPTASNFDRIITAKMGKLSAGSADYVAELIAERLCLTPNFFTDRPQTKDMEHGTNSEPEARRFLELERGYEVRQVGFCLADDGRFGCSPDGLMDPDGAAEIKCPKLKTQVKYLMAGPTLPDEYRPQVHGQLIVTGRKWVEFLSYSPGTDALMVRVVPDAYTVELRVCLELFHEQLQAAWKKIGNGREWPEVQR